MKRVLVTHVPPENQLKGRMKIASDVIAKCVHLIGLLEASGNFNVQKKNIAVGQQYGVWRERECSHAAFMRFHRGDCLFRGPGKIFCRPAHCGTHLTECFSFYVTWPTRETWPSRRSFAVVFGVFSLSSNIQLRNVAYRLRHIKKPQYM